MDEVKGQQGYWHCFWLTGAGAHPLSVLLIGTVVAKRLLWVPGKVLCPLQQVRSGEEDAQGREKESFSWSSGSALKKKNRYTLYTTQVINRVRMGKGVFLHLSLTVL